MSEIMKLSKRIKEMSLPLLKSNLKQAINEKYSNNKGWKIEVVKLLNMNINTFGGMINQSNISALSMDKLLEVINTLDLDIEKVLNVDNKIIKSTQGRYGNRSTVKWTDDKKENFLIEYDDLNNDKATVAKKYDITKGTADIYIKLFKEERKKL